MTDRTLHTAAHIDDLNFAKGDGLIPVVAQDADTGQVLMVAYADREALLRCLDTGDAWFFSRSRNALWRKGETSGNTLSVRSLHADCDADTVLALVCPAGPACHTGETSCFGAGAAPLRAPSSPEGPGRVLVDVDATLAQRAAERPGGSYTVRLLDDKNLRLKKLGEETAELVLALATEDAPRAREEAADLVYHVLVALRGAGLGLDDLAEELASRRG